VSNIIGLGFEGRETAKGWLKDLEKMAEEGHIEILDAVLVDGQEAWRGNIWGGDDGHFRNYLEISGLDPGIHTIQVENLGIDGGGGDDDAAMRYFGFSSKPMTAP